ncbi:hypothetical protein K7W42_17905 [Deinococcus sp. HMF7604]|uniref:hypothetical protein n=1 Tax=Deinococcus betulae TaxID=2873312 RepID=UPI001CCE80E5|nr:hypothetical protein [Deinococcus betulae]MBZ9752719.1 hypothetical protein [Deinococcus betulae]
MTSSHFGLLFEDDSREDRGRDGALIGVTVLEAQATAEVLKGLEELAKVNATAQANPQQAGFRAEVHHKTTFNADAIRKGKVVRAEMPRGNGLSDIDLKVGGKTVARAQVKNCKTVARTTKAVSDTKYDGMKKIVPKDQAQGVSELAAKRGVDGLGERNYADTSKAATAKLEHDGVSSRAVTYDELQSKDLGKSMLRSEAGSAAAAGAKNAAVVGGAVSAVSNIGAVINGEKTVGQAAAAMAKETAVAAGTGALTSAATTVVANGAAKVGLQAVSRSGAPGAIVAAGFEVGKDLVALTRGELSGTQVMGRSMEHAVGAGAGWGGASAGAALGTMIFPGVGTLVGGFLGGMLANAGARRGIKEVKSIFS